ncbi:hypothetical protein M3J09_000494 [Ascochyta lentis]
MSSTAIDQTDMTAWHITPVLSTSAVQSHHSTRSAHEHSACKQPSLLFCVCISFSPGTNTTSKHQVEDTRLKAELCRPDFVQRQSTLPGLHTALMDSDKNS